MNMKDAVQCKGENKGERIEFSIAFNYLEEKGVGKV